MLDDETTMVKVGETSADEVLVSTVVDVSTVPVGSTERTVDVDVHELVVSIDLASVAVVVHVVVADETTSRLIGSELGAGALLAGGAGVLGAGVEGAGAGALFAGGEATGAGALFTGAGVATGLLQVAVTKKVDVTLAPP